MSVATEQPGGIWPRAVATVVDLVLVVVAWFVAVWLFLEVLTLTGAVDPATLQSISVTETTLTPQQSTLALFAGGILLVLRGLYLVYAWAAVGHTPGQQLMGLSVRDARTGGQLSVGRAALRWFISELPGVGLLLSVGILAWYGLIALSIARSPSRRGMHDVVAGSVVVSRPREARGSTRSTPMTGSMDPGTQAPGPGTGSSPGGPPSGGTGSWGPPPGASPASAGWTAPPGESSPASSDWGPPPGGAASAPSAPPDWAPPPGPPPDWAPPGPPPGAGPASWAPPPPPGPAAGIYYASFWVRLVAYIIDGIILAIVEGIIGAILLGTSLAAGSLSYSTLAGAAVVNLLISAAYFVYTWTRMRASPGDRLLGLMVLNAADGSPLTTNQALLRWLLLAGPGALGTLAGYDVGVGAIISILVLVWYVYLAWTTYTDPRRQGFHDRYVQSVVVRGGLA